MVISSSGESGASSNFMYLDAMIRDEVFGVLLEGWSSICRSSGVWTFLEESLCLCMEPILREKTDIDIQWKDRDLIF